MYPWLSRSSYVNLTSLELTEVTNTVISVVESPPPHIM